MKAESLMLDADFYACGEIIDIEETDLDEGEQFVFIIRAKGVSKPIIQRFWTGKTISNEIVHYEKNGKKIFDYNFLTRVCLNLELIADKDLANPRTIAINELDKAIGLKVKYQVAAIAPSIFVPDAATIQACDA